MLHCKLDSSNISNLVSSFEDLLRNYESYSLGNVSFARAIIIGSYLNSAMSDSLECRFAIWSPKQHTARQITAKNSEFVS